MTKFFLFLISFLTISSLSWACDPCALFNASRLNGHQQNSFTLGLSEQYTSFDRAKRFADNSAKNAQLVKGFSTTQFSLAYDATQNFGLQINLPLIHRRFTQIENFRSYSDSETGIGDISLLATYSAIDHFDEDFRLLWGFTGGVKLPTGDTGTLNDINNANTFRHHPVGNGTSGGRALSLGSGSYDYIIGTNLLTRYQKLLFLADAQYTIRTEGDFNYEFADDLLWSVGPGSYLWVEHDNSLAFRLALLGEFKSKDKLNGSIVKGSQISNLYVGPELLATIQENIFTQLGFDFRVTDEDTDAQVVPDYRVRFNISYRF